MFLTSKIAWAGTALALLTTGMTLPAFSQYRAGSDSKTRGVPAFVVKNEIWKMQEVLRDKGHYRGKIDGAFGLRTRASVRAYQKAEGLPVTGEVDTLTAAGLGVRPESSWDNFHSAGRQDGHNSVAGESGKGKPSAVIPWAKGRPGNTPRKEVSQAAAIDDNRGSGAGK